MKYFNFLLLYTREEIMDVYSKLFITRSLEDIDISLIRKSIKLYFTKKWIDDNYQLLDYSTKYTEAIKNYTKNWIFNVSNISVDIVTYFDDMISSATLDDGSYCYPKFILNQLNNSYLFRNYEEFLFYKIDRANAEKQKSIDKFMVEFNDLEKNIDIIFFNISKDEILSVISDKIFYDVLSKYVTQNMNTFDSYYRFYKNSIENIVSPLGIDDVEINKYSDLFNYIECPLNDNIKTIIRNNISNICFGFSQIISEESLKVSSDLEIDLSKYVMDRLVESNIEWSKDKLNNLNKFKEMITKYVTEIVPESFFNNNMNDSETSTNIPPAFDQTTVENIYRRYNKVFTVEPEYFNFSIFNIFNILNGKTSFTKSKFNLIFIPEKLEEFFTEYCSYYIWSIWLNDLESERTKNPYDENRLVPLNISNLNTIKEKIKSIYREGLFNIKGSKDKKLIKSFEPFDGSREGLLPIEKKLILRETIGNRLKTFKFVRFTSNGMTEYEKYKYAFFKYLEDLYNSANDDMVNKLIMEINRIYNTI